MTDERLVDEQLMQWLDKHQTMSGQLPAALTAGEARVILLDLQAARAEIARLQGVLANNTTILDTLQREIALLRAMMEGN